jgi:hypothetical protein
LLDGLEDEGLVNRDGQGVAGESGPVDLTSADDADFAGLGLSVETV